VAINTFATLVTAATEWLARDQDATLIARIPDFITLLEAKANRMLFVPQMESRSTTTVDTGTTEPEYISLPTDFQTMRRIRLSSVTGKPSLRFLSGTQIDEMRYASDNVTDQPTSYTIIGSELELYPTPNEDYTLEMVYRATIPALNASNTTNWLLTLAPDFYLYGTLLESAPYIKEDGRIQTWALGLSTALDGLNNLGFRQSFDAGPSDITLPGVTP
jgi:hypothetical protein